MDRKSIVILMAMFIPSFVIGQTDKAVKATTQKSSHHEIRVDSLLSRTDSLIMINNELLYRLDIDLSLKNRYKLYETENIYTLLRLDTKTGMIDQVQWSLDSDKEGTITINGEGLTYGFGVDSGSFELYPTKNMYQFILMDKTNGRMWHVQWGFEFKKRWIQRIY